MISLNAPEKRPLKQEGKLSSQPTRSPYVRRAAGPVDSANHRGPGSSLALCSAIHGADFLPSLIPVMVVRWLWVALGVNVFLLKFKRRETELLSNHGL